MTTQGDSGDRRSPPAPGPFARMLLRALLTERERAEVIGELEELWERRVARDGVVRARRWYARELRRYALRLLQYRLVAWRRNRSGSDEEAGEGAVGGAAARPTTGGRSGVLEGFAADVRQAVRGWVKSPGLAATIVLTVGLGLGASTAMVAVVRAVLLDPLPYAEADRLERIYHAVAGNRWNLSVADYLAIVEYQTGFEGVAAYQTGEGILTTTAGAERVRVRRVTAGWFDLLGVPVAAGRTFGPQEGAPGAEPVAVVSQAFARRHFGDVASAVGAPIRLDGETMTVVGVLVTDPGPLEERHEVFPALQMATPGRRGPFTLTLIGRVRPDVDRLAAEAELREINRRVFPVADGDTPTTYGLMPLEELVVGRVETMVLVLLGAVAMVLLVASTNAAGLLTARAIRRRGELAIRSAVGASRGRLARHLVVESIVLSASSVLVALPVAAAAVGAVRAAGPDFLPRAGQVTLDAPTLGSMAALAALSVLLFGLLPAVQLMGGGTRIANALRSGGRTQTGTAAAHRVRRGLVAAQFAIALPLLVGAALLTTTFLRLHAVDPGFDGEGVLTLRVARTELEGDDGAAARAYWRELLDRVSGLPQVAAVGLNTGRPPREVDNINNFDPLDRPTPQGEPEPMATWLIASPGYFDALEIGLVAGRLFDGRDGPDSETTAAVVDRAWAEAVFPGQDPLGRRLYEGGCRAPECSIVEVVGVVEDVKYLGLGTATATGVVGTLYVPQAQWLASTTYLFVRVPEGNPLALVAPIRRIVRELDPGTAIDDIATADHLVDRALAAPRNIAALVLAFAAIAVLMALIGIYGVMSYFVHEHRREIGIRIVLGGRPRRVLQGIVGAGMRPVLVGTAAGLVLAALATRFTEHLLFGVAPGDPATLAAVAAAMLATALVACWIPTAGATRMDPGTVLRED